MSDFSPWVKQSEQKEQEPYDPNDPGLLINVLKPEGTEKGDRPVDWFLDHELTAKRDGEG